jgi:polyphosphate kinase
MDTNVLNRDLSWLKFNERVLSQAYDESLPLLERVRFLAIFNSNLDEFIMKRVGYLNRLIVRGVNRVGDQDISPHALLTDIRNEVLKLSKLRDDYLYSVILPKLKTIGVHVLDWNDLTDKEKAATTVYFEENVFPVLTPLAIDPAHPFPFLSNLSFSITVKLKEPSKTDSLFARIKIPNILPQWHRLPTNDPNEYRLVSLHQVVQNNIKELFPNMEVESVMSFRVARNADMKQVSDDTEDLLDLVEEELRQRRLAEIIRLEYSNPPMKSMLSLLKRELELEDDDLYEVDGPFIHHILGEIANLPIPGHHFKTWVPTVPQAIKDESSNMLDAIKNKDILVHHPYESFSASVERFLKDAVHDPSVFGIKITLYRTGDNSPLIPLLIQAAESGKQVVCVVELKARFDEARNIYWGEILESAGVHVVYGIVGLKTHAKSTLVIRKESDKFRLYAHIGTGNYNAATAKIYTDTSLFTSDKKTTSELLQVFNYLTGLSLKRDYKRFLVSPVNMKEQFIKLIRNEAKNAKESKPAYIVAKMNSLQDPEIMEELYKASQAGTKIDLIVRGFCCLKPKLKGLSDNIRVISTVGRFLEHSRIFYFADGKESPHDGEFYIGSADWMYRNLNKRVEVCVPVKEEDHKKHLWFILRSNLKDKVLTWEMDSNGDYKKRAHKSSDIGLHDLFMAHYKNIN